MAKKEPTAEEQRKEQERLERLQAELSKGTSSTTRSHWDAAVEQALYGDGKAPK